MGKLHDRKNLDLQEDVDRVEREIEGLGNRLTIRHRMARERLWKYKRNATDTTVKELIEALCRLVRLVRNNMSHIKSKFDRGRNREIFKWSVDVLDLFFRGLLGNPDQRLAVYHTLRPRGPDHHVIADITDERSTTSRVEGVVAKKTAVRHSNGNRARGVG